MMKTARKNYCCITRGSYNFLKYWALYNYFLFYGFCATDQFFPFAFATGKLRSKF